MTRLYEQCYMIRAFEKRVEEEFEKGVMRGTTHGCIGQEIIPVLTMNYVEKDKDVITGTHRCHGQILAYTGDPFRLVSEMMGKKSGFNYGMGGSQHIKYENYITNGVTGGMAAVGAGIAFSMKKKEGIVISFLGDGGFQEGYVQETLNMAQTFQVPILYIMENNKYAMSTCTENVSSGTVQSRVTAIGMQYNCTSSENIEELDEKINKAFCFVRTERKPFFLEVQTFRLCGHSKSDEREYMTEDEKQKNAENDPLLKLKRTLSLEKIRQIEGEIDLLIDDVFRRADKEQEMKFEDYQEVKKDADSITKL